MKLLANERDGKYDVGNKSCEKKRVVNFYFITVLIRDVKQFLLKNQTVIYIKIDIRDRNEISDP